MGMQQFGDPTNPYSVMIEIVAFGTPNSIAVPPGPPGADDGAGRQRPRRDAPLGPRERPRDRGPPAQDDGPAPAVRTPEHEPAGHVQGGPRAGPRRLAGDVQRVRQRVHGAACGSTRRSTTTTRGASRQSSSARGKRRRWGPGTGAARPCASSASPWMATSGCRPHTKRRAARRTSRSARSRAAPVQTGGIFELPMTFIPTENGTHTGTLTIVTHADAPGSVRVIRIALHASVEAFGVSLVDPVPPTPLDFGPVNVGDTRTVGVVVRADGTLAAYLDTYAAADPAGAAQLGVATIGVGSVPAEQTKTYWVSYTPTIVGPLSDQPDSDLRRRRTHDALHPGRRAARHRVGRRGAGGALADRTRLRDADGERPQRAADRSRCGTWAKPRCIVSGSITGSGFRLAGPLPASILPGPGRADRPRVRPGCRRPGDGHLHRSSRTARPPRARRPDRRRRARGAPDRQAGVARLRVGAGRLREPRDPGRRDERRA